MDRLRRLYAGTTSTDTQKDMKINRSPLLYHNILGRVVTP